MSHPTDPCPLCAPPGDEVLWQNECARVVRVDGTAQPGYTRVIWQSHVAEMTQLTPAKRQGLMDVVYLVEQIQRQELTPDKINLAALGNQVPHLHWHIIPRWRADSHFPEPIWHPTPPAERVAAWALQRPAIEALVPHYHARLIEALSAHLA
ncbi:MAG: HIT family protein [Alcaligenaceae bacterium]|nr:HIT family protein [Alcaligenaceae bacterium]